MQEVMRRGDVCTVRFAVNVTGSHTLIELFDSNEWNEWQVAQEANSSAKPEPLMVLMYSGDYGLTGVIEALQRNSELGSFVAYKFDGDNMRHGLVSYLNQNYQRPVEIPSNLADVIQRAGQAADEILNHLIWDPNKPLDLSFQERRALTDLVNTYRQLNR